MDKIRSHRRLLASDHLLLVENECRKKKGSGNPYRTDLEYRGCDKCWSQHIYPDSRRMLPPLLKLTQRMARRASLDSAFGHVYIIIYNINITAYRELINQELFCLSHPSAPGSVAGSERAVQHMSVFAPGLAPAHQSLLGSSATPEWLAPCRCFASKEHLLHSVPPHHHRQTARADYIRPPTPRKCRWRSG